MYVQESGTFPCISAEASSWICEVIKPEPTMTLLIPSRLRWTSSERLLD
jgi:hypothetical protein